MFAATCYDLLKSRGALSRGRRTRPSPSASWWRSSRRVIVVKAFLGYVSRHSFAAFAWYRIALGVLLLLLLR